MVDFAADKKASQAPGADGADDDPRERDAGVPPDDGDSGAGGCDVGGDDGGGDHGCGDDGGEDDGSGRDSVERDGDALRRRDRLAFDDVVGQDELKQALLAVATDDGLDGLLVTGEKGTAKSTLVRALADLLPEQPVVADCQFGCHPTEPALQCRACRTRDDPPTAECPVPLVTVPLGATRDRVVGTLSVADALEGDPTFEPGLLARAHRGILYVDEANLLDDHIVDVLLDAAASGVNRVERDGVSVTHPASFTLVGTMNPEEGDLRPQLRDRFALQATVTGCTDVEDRVAILDRALGRDADERSESDGHDSEMPDSDPADAADSDTTAAERLRRARSLLPDVDLSDDFARRIATLCRDAGVDGHRGDVATARAARALAALDGRTGVIESDVRRAAELALPHRLASRPFEDAPDASDLIDEQFEDDRRDDAGEDGNGSSDGGGSDSGGDSRASDDGSDGSRNDGSGGDGDESGRAGGAGAESGSDTADRVDANAAESGSGSDETGDDGERARDRRRSNDGDCGDVDGAARDALPEHEGTSESSDAPPPAPADATDERAPRNGGPQDDDASDEGTPLVPGQQRPDRADGSGPDQRRSDGSDSDRSNSNGSSVELPTLDGATEADESDGSRAGPSSATAQDGPKVRTRPADAGDPIDPTASVRAAAARGASEVQSRDLRAAVRRSDAAALVVFAVDVSASMRPAMRAARSTVLELLQDAYQQRDEVAFVAFASDDAEVLLPPTDSVQHAARHLKSIPTGDRTPLPAGLRTAADVVERADPATSVAVVVTDGRANVAEDSPVEATRQAAQTLSAAASEVLLVDAGDGGRGSVTDVVAEATGARVLDVATMTAERLDAAVAEAGDVDASDIDAGGVE